VDYIIILFRNNDKRFNHMPLLHSLQSSIRQLIDISVNACGRNGVVKAGILIQVISNMFSRTKDRLI